MKADSYKISKVFSSGGEIHYVLPHFQRQYSWDKSNWQTLLDDAIAIYEEYSPSKEPEHFLGSLVVINDGTKNGFITAFTLVNGQQRLTTISLLLCAFRDLIDSAESRMINRIQKLLVNSDAEGEAYFKLLPTNKYGDRQAYISLIQREALSETESKILLAYQYLYKELDKLFKGAVVEPEKFLLVLSNCFQVVFIELNKDESPYKIFESLNAKGKPLSQADLVRNYVAMRLPTAKQEKVFTEHWEKIENLLQESRTVGKSRIGELTAFLRHYLATQSRGLCSEAHTYARFRDRCEILHSDAEFIHEISLLRRFAEHYNKLLRPEYEKSLEIRSALSRLNILEIQTAYPFLLMVYDEYEQGILTLEQFKQILAILENYMVRRYVCREQTNDLNKVFPSLWRDIQDEVNAGDITFVDALKKILVSKNYPANHRVQQSIRSINIYDDRSREKICLILESINRHLSKDAEGFTVLDGKATIEHLMPQTLREEWKLSLGENFERVYQDYLNTLGNLTLVTQGWNSALSNSPFSHKKQILEKHELRLNKDYFSREIDQWNEQTILDRAEFLSENILEVWSALGEPTSIEKVVHGKPVAITILGNRIEIPNKTWRQVRILTVEWILQKRPQDFYKVRDAIGIFDDSIEGKNYPRDWYRLSNGVWMYHSSSAKQHIVYCRRILATIGISEPDWSIDEEEVPTLVS
ncbi:DUF262 domain-containing protein [Leptolyngbya sp. FACHB-17]|uniref:DUF262 domain-containing protein n=1 Tax=unclassified Leptolyngbya TaxID=2650499 RepID=UPI001681605E|nr:DUF262 domain-containing protein [Leptolyngbya sp. FACHB-17]MBD2083279.1 DUF262 domain-containing protein [Leptolyngbya sp. FACHB-17]